MSDGQPELLVIDQQGVLWLTFNRPHKANALSLPLLTEFNKAMKEAATREDVRAVVITGAGERNFSAGADLSRPAENTEAYLANRHAGFAAALLALVDFRKPVRKKFAHPNEIAIPVGSRPARTFVERRRGIGREVQAGGKFAVFRRDFILL